MYQHEPSSKDKNSHARPTLDIELHAFYGDISLSLPRSLAGQLQSAPVTTVSLSLLRSQSVSCCSLKSHWQASGHTLVGDRPEDVVFGCRINL